MFNEWLTYQEKEDFLAQLDDEGWKLKFSTTLEAYGASCDLYKIQKIPNGYVYTWRSMKVNYNRTTGKYLVELFDTKYEKFKKEKVKKEKKEKDKKDKNK